jgi:hypothetical protein
MATAGVIQTCLPPRPSASSALSALNRFSRYIRWSMSIASPYEKKRYRSATA